MHLRLLPTLFAALLIGFGETQLARAAEVSTPEASTSEAVEFFEREVRPLLAAKCFACHSDATDEPKGGLRLDSLAAVLRGGDSGPTAVAGDIRGSLLIDAISYESGLDMPPSEPLSAAERKILERWVQLGLPWSTATPPPGGFDLAERIAAHWAWQPRRTAPPPETSEPTRSAAAASPIDRFIRHALDEVGLEPAERTSRPALLRRLYFDVIGLPPTPEAIERFVQDDRPDALDRVVDRLLADPQFGVRWGRHWLDLVRYAETYGHEFDYPIPHAWKYRDWVVDALNEDLPYDRFAREQLAGDLVNDPRRDPVDQTNRSLPGSGFWWLGDAVHAPVDARGDHASRVENQIDVAGKTFLGLTIACARCHDHKFDAILQSDYYAIGGLLHSTTRSLSPLDPNGRTAAAIAEVRRAADELRQAVLASPTLADVKRASPTPDLPNGDEPTRPTGAVLFDFSADQAATATTTGWAFESPPGPSEDWEIAVRTAPVAAPTEAFPAESEPAEQATPVAPAFPIPQIVIEPASWVDSGRLGGAAVGVWRSPPFEITGDTLAYRVIGEGGGEVRLVVEGYFMNDYHQLLFGGIRFQPQTGGQWQWHIQRGDLRHYIGQTAHIELVDDGAGFVGLSQVRWLKEGENPPADDPASSPTRALVRDELPPLAQQRLDGFLKTAASLPSPIPVLAAGPLPPRDIPLAIRGDANAPGEPVPRGDLTALASSLGTAPAGSQSEGGGDRLQLARNWTSPDNPLFARVAVNRLWHHLTGRGLVASCDNFGVLGDSPSHPELLDYLAEDFVAREWSSKRSIREIVRTETYALRSEPRSEALAVDPTNRLLHTARVRRLEGEVIRDAALQLAGWLDRRIGGPSVPIHLSEEMTGRGRPAQSGPLDGAGRRSLYVAVRRNFLSPTMLAFDTPMPATTAGRRNVSNVPAQALVMLNHPLFHEASAAWAARPGIDDALPSLSLDPPEWRMNVERRVTRMYQEAFGRAPSATEIETAVDYLSSVVEAARPAAWQDLAHVLINVKEFIFLP